MLKYDFIALKLEIFYGSEFRRWKSPIKFWLTTLGQWVAIEDPFSNDT